MYTIVTIADVVQIHPSDFHKPSRRAIEDFINAKYADKVIHKIGLCVGFHSLITASEGRIGHGTGIVNVNVDFTVVVFRPFKGEIIRGTIAHSNQLGIYMSMDFFEDIVAPATVIFSPSSWEADESGTQLWVWRTAEVELWFDRTEMCLMRAEQENWTDLSPQMKGAEDTDSEIRDEYGMRPTPYRLLVSMEISGLGPDLWWLGEEAAEVANAQGISDGSNEVEMAP